MWRTLECIGSKLMAGDLQVYWLYHVWDLWNPLIHPVFWEELSDHFGKCKQPVIPGSTEPLIANPGD